MLTERGRSVNEQLLNAISLLPNDPFQLCQLERGEGELFKLSLSVSSFPILLSAPRLSRERETVGRHGYTRHARHPPGSSLHYQALWRPRKADGRLVAPSPSSTLSFPQRLNRSGLMKACRGKRPVNRRGERGKRERESIFRRDRKKVEFRGKDGCIATGGGMR